MLTVTLIEPDAEQQLLDTYNRGMAAVQQVDLALSTKYALCLVKLNPTVTPADYPALKAAIEGVTGVQEITLVIDHETRADVPAGKQLVVVIELNARIEDVPEA